MIVAYNNSNNFNQTYKEVQWNKVCKNYNKIQQVNPPDLFRTNKHLKTIKVHRVAQKHCRVHQQ